MQFRTHIAVWAFTLSVVLFTLVSALVLNNLIFPKEILDQTLIGTAKIVFIITIPVAYFIGAKVLQNTLLSDELKRLVNRDRLTDVATRDFFFSKLNDKTETYGVSLMVDIDHFKVVNDTYGHLAGDIVIRHVAQILQVNCRPLDIVCRFGGEEFVIFLHHASLEDGQRIAERIRAQVQAEPAFAAGVEISVTVSIGGSLKDAAAHIEGSVKRADEALYRAKALGRNQIVVPAAA